MKYSDAEIQRQVDKLVDILIMAEREFYLLNKDISEISLSFQFAMVGFINNNREDWEIGLNQAIAATQNSDDRFIWKKDLAGDLIKLKEMVKDRNHVRISSVPVHRRGLGCATVFLTIIIILIQSFGNH